MDRTTKYIATKEGLLRALAKAKVARITETTPPPTLQSPCEEVSPFTLREGLFYVCPEL